MEHLSAFQSPRRIGGSLCLVTALVFAVVISGLGSANAADSKDGTNAAVAVMRGPTPDSNDAREALSASVVLRGTRPANQPSPTDGELGLSRTFQPATNNPYS